MRIYEIINNKKRGKALSPREISWVVKGFSRGEIPDAQMSALLMAIYFQGMNSEETAALTTAMVNSGETVSLAGLNGFAQSIKTVDKHSTGGVGDKTTLAVVPIVAACGVPFAKMSGRGLGHTGGTIDKLEAIPGYRTNLTGAEFTDIVNKVGCSIAGQSANLTPADKKIYALRDVTATVDSIPLIAASIMSKKIAAGADAIFLDVKTGSGAFMKNPDDALVLAQTMVEIGKTCGRETAAYITDMNVPLGYAVGNSLEVLEIYEFLSGKPRFPQVSERLLILCREISAKMLQMAGKGCLHECLVLVQKALESGEALQKFLEMIKAHGGDISYLENPAPAHIIKAPADGYISEIDTEGVGLAAMTLGAGREKPGDKIDYTAGIILRVSHGDYVTKNDILAELHTSTTSKIFAAAEKFLSSIVFSPAPPRELPLIYRYSELRQAHEGQNLGVSPQTPETFEKV
ncbi:MAG: thymidine phosphorylase [Defluviitaleaceae bacterium]|nr:thymidine phosphorylase [Defluviitaleaceae bacterium]